MCIKPIRTLAVLISFIGLNQLAFSAGMVSPSVEQTSRLRITNQCTMPLWIQQDFKSTTTDPIVVQIPQGFSYDYTIPASGLASTRFWAKSGCNSSGYDCNIGESTGVPSALDAGQQHGPFGPDLNSKFEASWGCLDAIYSKNPNLCAPNPSAPGHFVDNKTWWNGSVVDGYTFPYNIIVKKDNGTCTDTVTGKKLDKPGVDCSQLNMAACPTNINLSTDGKYNLINGVDVTHVNLQWKGPKDTEPTGCFSPCAKLTTAQGSDDGSMNGGLSNVLGKLTPESPESQMYCCPTPPVSPGVCSAGPAATNDYTKMVHQQHCNSYTYAYDDGIGLTQCGSQITIEVVFCPTASSPTPTPTPSPTSVSMRFVIPTQMTLALNGNNIGNGQSVNVSNGGVITSNNPQSSACTLAVNESGQVSSVTGLLCANLQINNSTKTITVLNPTPSPTPTTQMQFNLNTNVGIDAKINQSPIVNAQKLDVYPYIGSASLSATQSNKMGTCELTIKAQSIAAGSGELCSRLNIATDGQGVINIYLPADIPQMGSADTTPSTNTHSIVFGMDNSQTASFASNIITNGTKIAMDTLVKAKQYDLIASQNNRTVNCVLNFDGHGLTIVPNSGLLCASGLVIISEPNGDEYVALPNPLPGNQAQGTLDMTLGIAQGMSVNVGNQVVRWDSPNKNMVLNSGDNKLTVTGASGAKRQCTVTVSGKTLNWPSTSDCQGFVQQGNVLYFPAF